MNEEKFGKSRERPRVSLVTDIKFYEYDGYDAISRSTRILEIDTLPPS